MSTLEDFESQSDVVFAREEAVARGLRKKFALEVKEMSKLRPWKSVLALVFDWAVVVGAIILCEMWFNPLSYLLAATIIAGRQHALLVLAHDAAHFRISSHSLINDFMSDFFAAIPAFFDTKMYRLHHAKHHRFLNTDNDPDWSRKRGRPEWQFPISKMFILKTYPKFIIFNGAAEWMTLSLFFSGILPLNTIFKGDQRKQFLKRVVYFGIAAAIFTYMGVWKEFFMYWVVPLLFVFPSFQRVRSVAEHFGLKCDHELNSSRNVLAPWYETMFFAPHSVNYHLTHHIFPGVPFYNLKRLNKLMMTDTEYRKLAHQNLSYVVPSAYPLTQDLLSESVVGDHTDGQSQVA